MKESMLLESVSGAFFIMALWGAYVFGRYILRNWHEGYMFLRPAIALECLWLGESWLRGFTWFYRHFINQPGTDIQPPVWVIIVGSVVITVAILCCIRIFDLHDSEGQEGNSWLWALITAVIFVTVSLNY